MSEMSLFCDGGVIKRNPSKIGGTWAWCQVKNNQVIRSNCGVIRPVDMEMPSISNNLSELFAAIKALTALNTCYKDIPVVLYTDSKVTMHRLTDSVGFAGIPNDLRLRTLELRRLWHPQVILVGGHPSKKELETGLRERNGFPVSQWNVWCDKTCRKLAWEWVTELEASKKRERRSSIPPQHLA